MVISTIAKNTFKESMRDRFFVIFFLIGIGLVSLSVFLGIISFDEQIRILFNVGLMGVHFAIISLAIFMGSFVMGREIERQTCLLVLARPVSRTQFLLGKFLGTAVLVSNMSLLMVILIGALIDFQMPPQNLVFILIGIIIEALILYGLGMAFGLFMRPIIAVAATFCVYLFGHWLPDFNFFIEKSQIAALTSFGNVMNYVVPNLHRFDWRSSYWLNHDFPVEKFNNGLLHGIAWLLLVILISDFAFRRKDIV